MNFRERKRDRSEDRGDHRAGCQSVYPDRDDRAGRFFEAFACGIKRTKADFSKIFHTRIFWKIQDTLKEQAKGLYIQLEKTAWTAGGKWNGCRLHRMMKKRCLETAAESSAAASKGSTGLCGNNLSVRGSKGEGAGGEKCTGRKTCGCDTD